MVKTLNRKLFKTLLPVTLAISLMGTSFINVYATSVPSTSTAPLTTTSTAQVLPKSISTIVSYDLTLGYNITLPVSFYPSNTTNKAITWSSDNTNVVAIKKDGVLHGKAVGAARVTATASNGVSTTCIIRVKSAQSQASSIPQKAVLRAYDYYDLFGVKSKNPASPTPGDAKIYFDVPYSDGKRYTDCGGFVWFCYRSTGLYLADKTNAPATSDDMIKNPGKNFTSLTLKKSELKPGDVITYLDYYKKGMSHAAIFVGVEGNVYTVIDMSPNGLQKRNIDTISTNTTYNVIRYNK